MEKLFVGDGEVKVEGDVIDLETAFVGSSRKPMTATPTRRQRPHSNHLNPN